MMSTEDKITGVY